MNRTVDCRGLACPKPVILTKKALDDDIDGVVSIVDNDVAKQNVQKLAESMGYEYATAEREGLFYITINKGCRCNVTVQKNSGIVIVIGSDMLGQGDEKLGTALMKSYIFALSESDLVPQSLLFLNSGVKLTTEGSEVIESLNTLLKKGSEIISCGTCLDFYNIKDKLVIGTVTNMYTIVEKMNTATNTIMV